jgi:ribosome-binding factor A
MSQRVDRLAGEIRQVLGEILSRQEIKDPRVRDAGLITLTHVRLTGDLRQATALFMVHGADRAKLEEVRAGLLHAAGYVRHRLGRELSVRAIPTVSFEIDEIFEKEARVDSLLREIAPAAADVPASRAGDEADGADGDDGGAKEGVSREAARPPLPRGPAKS